MLKHRDGDRERGGLLRRRHEGANGDDRSERKRRDDDDGRDRHADSRDTSDRGSTSSRMLGSRAVLRAKAHLAELTGRASEGVSALQRTRDGWRVVLEIVELQRIPHTTDIMASYAVDLDGHGELMGYQRVARYYRSDVDGD